MKVINIATEFSNELTNRDEHQRDGKNNGKQFRNDFLAELEKEEAWKNDNCFAQLNFKDVIKLGPSWANEVFAFYTKYAKPEKILKKLDIINISQVKIATIKLEMEKGYRGK